jgi:hypothetical protein
MPLGQSLLQVIYRPNLFRDTGSGLGMGSLSSPKAAETICSPDTLALRLALLQAVQKETK